MHKRTILTTLILIIWLILSTNITSADNQQLPPTTGDGTLRRLRVPILMYHYVSELPPDADDIRIGLTVSPQLFREHVQYLHSHGYTTISLYEMNSALEYGTQLPAQPVILTFDDGYTEHYTTVFPILQEFGFTGTFFIITDFADKNRTGHLSWDQITEMANVGMSMESHTKTHSDLRTRDYDFLVYEFLGSIESIKSHTGIEPRFFAYPVGHYDDNTLDVLATTRILRAVTTQTGTFHTTTNRLLMPRMRVTNTTGVLGLQGLLDYQQ